MFEETLKELEAAVSKTLQELKQKKIGNIMKESDIDSYEHRKQKAGEEVQVLEEKLKNLHLELDQEKQKALASIQERDRRNEEKEKMLTDKAQELSQKDFQLRMLESDLAAQKELCAATKSEYDRLISMFNEKMKKLEEITRA